MPDPLPKLPPKALLVVTTLPDYKFIAESIGGDRVEVNAIVQGDQDAHFIRPKPSFVSLVARADVPEHAHALWQALVQAQRVFLAFRAEFRGKVSPVHFFWGSFDLAVTRFSGRTAPPHPGGVPNFPDWVAREAYSHEVTSVGFWPGNATAPTPIFYAYAYPTPDGFADAAADRWPVRPPRSN